MGLGSEVRGVGWEGDFDFDLDLKKGNLTGARA
jgi:hypothetical protein